MKRQRKVKKCKDKQRRAKKGKERQRKAKKGKERQRKGKHIKSFTFVERLSRGVLANSSLLHRQAVRTKKYHRLLGVL